MRSYKVEGIIIKRRNYGEADRIFTVMTRHQGKLHVKAAGIRKIPSRRSAHVELLNHAVLNLYRGRTYPILTEAQSIEDFYHLKNDMDTIGLAFHLCELIDGLCPENQEHPEVFDLLKDALTRLSYTCHSNLISQDFTTGPSQFGIVKDAASTQSLIHNFEIELLSMLGYWNNAQVVSDRFDTHDFIEDILERKLKSRSIFSKLQ